jgi:hypothetical protein
MVVNYELFVNQIKGTWITALENKMANQSQDGGKLRVIGKSNQKDLDYSSRE